MVNGRRTKRSWLINKTKLRPGKQGQLKKHNKASQTVQRRGKVEAGKGKSDEFVLPFTVWHSSNWENILTRIKSNVKWKVLQIMSFHNGPRLRAAIGNLCTPLCRGVCVLGVGDSLAGVNKYSRKNETCKSIGSLGNEEQSARSARERERGSGEANRHESNGKLSLATVRAS